jgi:hypothetical protein
MENGTEEKSRLDDILHKYCKTFALITLRDMAQGKRLDYAYHVKLRRNVKKEQLIEALSAIGTIKGLHLLMQETTVEL